MTSTETVSNAGAERIAAAFTDNGKRAALMPYLMGGFPTIEGSLAIGHAYADGGADLVELGIPFSDPLADGPVVAAAGAAALRAGTTVAGVLTVCEGLAPRFPVVLMCYANQVLVHGAEAFAARLRDAGASGLIVPDLPMEEAPAVLAACDAAGLALVPLVAPTTPDERLRAIGSRARGFLYTVSVTGTTGERHAPLGEQVAAVVGRAKTCTDVPVALGFGITSPEQASEAADAGADGVIVGSRLVREAAEAKDPAKAVRTVVAALADGLR
ncbi:Tryptophan synthase alpha chain [Paraconexibacter sp. AEG42_29]|uniref:Tryptophan synthase alpha chain n=1 Tax=Paraconexibacter sp. AEG42_29 TaxID=2997339 RepID=A0AAU7AY32_9ACTN